MFHGNLRNSQPFFSGRVPRSRRIQAVGRYSGRKIKRGCPGVTWKESYATLGRFDVVDIVEASDIKQVEKAAMIIRAYGHSTTETLQGTPWNEFLGTL